MISCCVVVVCTLNLSAAAVALAGAGPCGAAVPPPAVVQWCSVSAVQWCSGSVGQWCSAVCSCAVQWYSGQWCIGAVVQWCSAVVVQWYSGILVSGTCSSPQLTVRLRQVCGAREDLEERETEDSLDNMGTEDSPDNMGTEDSLEVRGTGEPLEGRGTEDTPVTGTVLVGQSESMLSTLGLVSHVSHHCLLQ